MKIKEVLHNHQKNQRKFVISKINNGKEQEFSGLSRIFKVNQLNKITILGIVKLYGNLKGNYLRIRKIE